MENEIITVPAAPSVAFTANIQTMAVIVDNKEEFFAYMDEVLDEYKTKVFDENNVAEAATTVAFLRKQKDVLKKKRIEIHKETEKPYNEFASVVNEAEKKIDEIIAPINKIIAKVEEKRIEDRKALITELIKAEMETVETPYRDVFGSMKPLMDISWLNKTTSVKKIKDEIHEKTTKVISEIDALGVFDNCNHATELLVHYCNTDLASTLEYRKQIEKADELTRKANEEKKAAEASAQEPTPFAPVVPTVSGFPGVPEPVASGFPGAKEPVVSGFPGVPEPVAPTKEKVLGFSVTKDQWQDLWRHCSSYCKEKGINIRIIS